MLEIPMDQTLDTPAMVAPAPALATPSPVALRGGTKIAQAQSSQTNDAADIAARFLWGAASSFFRDKPRLQPLPVPVVPKTVWHGEAALVAAIVAPIGAVGGVACSQGTKRAGFTTEDSVFLCLLPMLGVGTTMVAPIAHFARGSVWRGVVSTSMNATLSLGTAALFALKPVTSKDDSEGRWFSASIGFGIGTFAASIIDAFALSWYTEPAKPSWAVLPWVDIRGDSVAGGLRGSF